MNNLPRAKTTEIVEQDLGDELLIYDLSNNQAFCLNETSAKVFRACDGTQTFASLIKESGLTEDLIYLALDELQKRNLLESNYVSPFAGLSRREVIRKVGLASMIALPVISALVAPTASNAASGAQSDCARRGGTCIGAGNNLCAGRANQTVDFYYYNTGNGTCGGNSFASNPSFPCGNSAPSSQSFDVCRVG